MRAEDRRRQLLGVAAECFARDGYRATTTAGLAARAGVTAPVIYRHFRGKHDLFAVLVADACDRAIESWRTLLAATPPAQRLERALGESMPAPITRFEHLIATALTEAVREPAITEVASDSLRRLADALAAAFGPGSAHGPAKPGVLAWLAIRWRLGGALIAAAGPGETLRNAERALVRAAAATSGSAAGTPART